MSPDKETYNSALDYLSKKDRKSLLRTYYKRKGHEHGLTKNQIRDAVGPLESIFKEAKIRKHLLALAEKQIIEFARREKKHKK